MPRTKKKVVAPPVEETPVEAKPQMSRIAHDYSRADLNEMRDRVNELIDKQNCKTCR